MLHRRDDVQLSSLEIAQGKARTSLMFKRPSKVLDDAISGGGGGLRFLALPNIVPLEGGMPIILDGKIIGAVGVSGVLSAQDAQIARAGLEAVTLGRVRSPGYGPASAHHRGRGRGDAASVAGRLSRQAEFPR